MKRLDGVMMSADLVPFRELGLGNDVLQPFLEAASIQCSEFNDFFKSDFPDEVDLEELAYDVKDSLRCMIEDHTEDANDAKHWIKMIELCAFAVAYLVSDNGGTTAYVHLSMVDKALRTRVTQGVVNMPEVIGYSPTH